MKPTLRAHFVLLAIGGIFGAWPAAARAVDFLQTNLVSTNTTTIPATFEDDGMTNAWGVATAPGGPFWVNANGGGRSSIYNSTGVKQSLEVLIKGPGGGLISPTGIVYNGSANFNGDLFLFASEDGVIAGWRPALSSVSEVLSTASNGAVYKGLAINTAQNTIYATDFHNGHIDTFGTAVSGTFTDPNLPAGFAPFNVTNISGTLYVTYAKQDADAHDDVAGAGNGYVDTYDLSGNFIKRLVSGGSLNSPWGLAIAPSSFGEYAGDLLVGNFGDGRIHAYDPSTGSMVGELTDALGDPISIDGLWALQPGNGGQGGDLDKLYFTAGPNGESDGLLGSLAAAPATVPEPGTLGVLALGGLMLLRRRRAGK